MQPAASLGKYGNIPVSAYTGVPNSSIPLYTAKSGNIALSLSISYHAGGNKAEEKASSVGLGWTLNAGGAIARTIRGFDDELEFGFLDCYCHTTCGFEYPLPGAYLGTAIFPQCYLRIN